MKKYPLVSIIVLNLNNKVLLENCLMSISKNTEYHDYKIIIVDNNSSDNSVNFIKRRFKDVDIIQNKTNRGFSGGNNDGIKYALNKYSPDYFYLLNNDTVVEPGWLDEVVRCAEKSKDIGVIGSKQLTFDRKPAISAGWIGPFGVKYYHGSKNKDVGWVSGAGMLIKRSVIDRIGLLDERYNPAYYEETDFEKRALDAGFRIVHCPTSVFLHKGGATSSKELSNASGLFYRNRFIFFVKNYDLLYFLPRIFFDILKSLRKEGLVGVQKLFGYYSKGYLLINKK